MPDIELTWCLADQDEDQETGDLLAAYYTNVANGPMRDYRQIIQGGSKQGQNYYVHVLDGINVLHKLRTAQVVEMDDLEEVLLFTAYTIHDLNKIPPYGGREVTESYGNIVTLVNIQTELKRIDIARFFADWEEYLEDIRLLMLLHQHDAATLSDLNKNQHAYSLPHRRLLELGKLMYAVDNLDLSHTLTEKNLKQNALASINSVAEDRWRWVTHCLGENRALLSNLVHNTLVNYLQDRYKRDTHSSIVDLLYYPDGVAYLLPERETFTWSENDNAELAQRVVKSIEKKQSASLHQLIKASQLGIRVSQAARESGASYTDILYALRERVENKAYSQTWHSEYNQKLRPDVEAILTHSDPAIVSLAAPLLDLSEAIVPHEQALLKRGELALAFYNLLNDHLKEELKKAHQCDPWTHVYTQLHLPEERYSFYNCINHYRRAYFIARDCQESIDILFQRMLENIVALADETQEEPEEHEYIREYLAEHLEFQGSGYARDFQAHLRYYCQATHKQCCMCSSSFPTTKLMSPEVPANIGVQVFSNRLRGGSGEPKRNVCPVCRTQLVLEKLTRVAFKKGSEGYANFYLHLYPYAFFTRSYQDAIYFTLKNLVHEDSQCFFFKRESHFRNWNKQLDQAINTQLARQVQRGEERAEQYFQTRATKVNGVSVPLFSEAACNTPAFPLNAPGENYAQQFLFALTHALMIADFFGCRVALSRTPFPLLSNDYMADHQLAFFVDNIPLHLRWIAPANEYRSIETYRDRQARDGGAEYLRRKTHWQHEQLDKEGNAAYENVSRRLSILYQLSHRLQMGPGESEEFMIDVAMALADDPLSVYHIADLAIEKQIKGTRTGSDKENTKGKKRSGGSKSQPGRSLVPEQMAIYFTKRIAPILAEIAKE